MSIALLAGYCCGALEQGIIPADELVHSLRTSFTLNPSFYACMCVMWFYAWYATKIGVRGQFPLDATKFKTSNSTGSHLPLFLTAIHIEQITSSRQIEQMKFSVV